MGVILDPFTAEVEAEIISPTSGVVFFALKKPLTTEHEVAFKVIRRLFIKPPNRDFEAAHGKINKNKVIHCNTLQNTKLPDEKVAALFRLKETAKNAILSLTKAKALSEKIAKRLFLSPAGRLSFYGWVSTSGSPGL